MSDLFDFFRENESKLHERPSEQVWKNLENRLRQNRRPRRRGILFLQLGAVALIILLLLLVAAVVWYYARR